MSDRAPTLSDVINRAMEQRLLSTRVSLPGRIESFDPDTQLATVKPLIKNAIPKEDGTFEPESLPVINGVPCVCLSGGDFGLQFPIARGDTCELIFSDRSIDLWKQSGGDVDPIDFRSHHLSDAVAIVGLKGRYNALGEYDAAAIQLGKQGGPRVRVTDTHVNLGGASGESPTDAAVLGTTYRNAESTQHNTIQSALGTCTASMATVMTALSSFAIANSAPLVGGGIAAPFMVTVVTQLGTISAQLGNILSALSTFEGSASSFLSTKVNLK